MHIKFRKTATLIALSLLLAMTACDRWQSAVKQDYSKDGLAFTHFSDWKITEDKTTEEAVGDVRFISIEGPHDSILMISRFPSDAAVTLESYVELLQSGMKEETQNMTGGVEVFKVGDGNLSSVEARIAGETRRGLAREFDIKVLSLPVPHRAETFFVENETGKWFLVAQSSKEDWEKLKAGFQTIFDSLSLAAAAQGSGNFK